MLYIYINMFIVHSKTFGLIQVSLVPSCNLYTTDCARTSVFESEAPGLHKNGVSKPHVLLIRTENMLNLP
uniref:Uncharacterized protein n=1 Tax=Pararge aegeria TaxID=116150 RepID=S4P0Q6_9NEOP